MRTVGTFLRKGYCSETLFYVLNRAFENRLTDEERASGPLAGGIMQHGCQCGMIWGSALAAGAQAYRLLGAGPQAQARAVAAAARIMESFRHQNENTDCHEITGMDNSSSSFRMFKHFFLKGGIIGCFRMAARYAPLAFSEINDALSQREDYEPPAPLSCSALLAKKMGASDMHAVVVAGLAGGIGLSGGGCGALGAAVWIMGMESLRKGASKVAYKPGYALDAVERFLERTGNVLECSRIVKRKFDGIGDHAAYLRGGGCSEIIETLAAG